MARRVKLLTKGMKLPLIDYLEGKALGLNFKDIDQRNESARAWIQAFGYATNSAPHGMSGEVRKL